jgi:hypothetical protein
VPLPVFVIDKLPTLLLFVKLRPVAEDVVNELPVMISVLVAFSEMAPVDAVKDTVFKAPAESAPFRVKPALLVRDTAPVPLCVILLTPKLPLNASTNVITPIPVLVAAKLEIAFNVPANDVPVTELVVNVFAVVMPTAPV